MDLNGSRTPQAVTASGEWDAATTKAKVTYTASEDGDLKEYQLRGCPGPEFETEDEVVLAHRGPAEAREYFSDFSLGLPGNVAGFRVVVVLNEGGTNGSEPVYVTRPTPSP